MDFQTGGWDVSLQSPQRRLCDEPTIGLVLPILVEVQAGEAERAALVGTLPAPGDCARKVVDGDLQQRSDRGF